MAVEINEGDPRDVKALVRLKTAPNWLKVRLSDGRKFYGIPSASRLGVFYRVNTQECTCEDQKFNQPANGCYHRRMVKLWVSLVHDLESEVAARDVVKTLVIDDNRNPVKFAHNVRQLRWWKNLHEGRGYSDPPLVFPDIRKARLDNETNDDDQSEPKPSGIPLA